MLCYLGKSFCAARCATVECDRQFTDAVRADAIAWWKRAAPNDPDSGPPVSWMDFSSRCPDYQPLTEET